MVSRVNLIWIWRQAGLAHEPRAAELRLHARRPVLSTQPRLSVTCGLAAVVIWAATGLRYF
jgi:hypothetical protein